MLSSFLASTTLFFSIANAFPFGFHSRAAVGVTPEQLSNFTLFSQYAGAAYCHGNINGKAGTNLKCSGDGGSCPGVEAAKSTILQSFTTKGGTQTEGYVALDSTNKFIVVAFQGTQIKGSPLDVITDLDIIQKDTPLCGKANTYDGCNVHNGFYRSMVDASALIKPTLDAAIKAHPDFKVVTTGHSLGGATAALLGTSLRNQGHIVDIYTYGQPHLGKRDISNYIQSQAPKLGMNYRITHANDLVPQLPPHKMLPEWDHYYPEYWVRSAAANVGAGDITVVQGSLYSTAGNEGATARGLDMLRDLFTGVEAHSDYFGKISACQNEAPGKIKLRALDGREVVLG